MEHWFVIRLFVVLSTLLSWSNAGVQTVKEKDGSKLPPLESGLNVYASWTGITKLKLEVGTPQGNERTQGLRRIATHEQFQDMELENHSVVVFSNTKIYYRKQSDEMIHDESHNDKDYDVNKILSRGSFCRVDTLVTILELEPLLAPKLMKTLVQYGESINTARRIIKKEIMQHRFLKVPRKDSIGSKDSPNLMGQTNGVVEKENPIVKEQQRALGPLNILLLKIKDELDKNIGVSNREKTPFASLPEGIQPHDASQSGVIEPIEVIILRTIETSIRLKKQNDIIVAIIGELNTPPGTLNKTGDGLLNEILRRVKQLMVPDSRFSLLKRAASLPLMPRSLSLSFGRRSSSASSTSSSPSTSPPSSPVSASSSSSSPIPSPPSSPVSAPSPFPSSPQPPSLKARSVSAQPNLPEALRK